MTKKISVSNLEDIKNYFSTSNTPYYFVSATNFNLMNIEKWVKNWHNINFIDCFDNTNKSILLPEKIGTPVFENIEAINSFLLGHKDIVHLVEENNKILEEGKRGQVIFLFFNKELEDICHSLSLDVCLPPTKLVKSIDNKITTTEIGNEAGVASVPNALEKVSSYASLRSIAEKHHLGNDLVVQSAFGDSGKTTYFISNEADYDQYAAEIEPEDKVKIMKRIQCAGTAIEGCATRAGTFVGPLLTELIGFPELTPYQGGWCGNELYSSAFSDDVRQQAMSMTERLGNALYARGYRGYFEVDYLIDLDTGTVYLGELNPRITGISAMTNMSDFCCENIPLFLFHLLEYSDVELKIDPSEYNQSALLKSSQSLASQLIVKNTESQLKIITQAPTSGIYTFTNTVKPTFEFIRKSYDRREALAENEVFILRIMAEGEYAYKGADLAIVFTNIQLKTAAEELSKDANQFIEAFNKTFCFRDLTSEETALVKRYTTQSKLKESSNE